MSRRSRVEVWGEAMFMLALQQGTIRPASPEDMHGTHRKRTVVQHPHTNKWWVRKVDDAPTFDDTVRAYNALLQSLGLDPESATQEN